MGFFIPGESPAQVSSLAADLRVRATLLSVYASQPSYTSVTWLPSTGMRMLLAVGAVTPQQATAIGQFLVAHGQSDAIIRIMWEMNGNWFPWGAQALSASQYIGIFRAAVTAFRAVAGNHFQYVWNVNAGSALPGRSEFDTYPGSAYVSDIGIDWYAQNGGHGAPAATIPPILQFAAQQGKPVSFDEWGVDAVADPAPYIDYVAQVVHSPTDHVAFQVYFSATTSDILNYPLAISAYRAAFSRGC